MTLPLPAGLLTRPVTHRALHDVTDLRPENSRAAVRAAIAAGYGIEIDLQLSGDGQAMVFHDYDLGRLTDDTGPVQARSAAELGRLALKQGDGEGIPTLLEILEIVNGQVPLLIELKDQDGAMGDDLGPLEEATAQALAGYGGVMAVMSFNPNSVYRLKELLPDVPRGITTSGYDPKDWPLSDERCAELRGIPDLDRCAASFISHHALDLDRARVQDLRNSGLPILCWTVRSPEAERRARALADNITFENYLAPFPG